jgi:DNA-binding NarL/FixJ family response regulator
MSTVPSEVTEQEQTKIRIVVAAAQALFREAVAAGLGSEADVEIVGEARTGLEAVAVAERTRSDVAVLDADLPNCDAIKATGLIKERVEGCRIMILVAEEDPETLVGAVEAGASAYLSKRSPFWQLTDAARAIHRGDTLVPVRMLGPLIADLLTRRSSHAEAMRKIADLTRREREVLGLLASGSDNQHIAQQLVISPQTARTHIQNVLGKLGVHSRLEAAAFVRHTEVLQELNGGESGRDLALQGSTRPAV